MSIVKLMQPLMEVFFPRSCVHCGDRVEGSEYGYLCRDCSRELLLSKPPACSICGYPFFGMIFGPTVCPHCVELNPVFEAGRTLFLAKGPVRSLVHELKYRGGTYIFEDVDLMVAKSPYFRTHLEGSVLVPVPLYPTKERERGFNQSQLIAERFLKATGAVMIEKLLVRKVHTATQTRLSRSLRHQNVKNAFALAHNAVVIPDQVYILVDDVFTTGATLNACAAVLRDAGAQRIRVATLGHG